MLARVVAGLNPFWGNYLENSLNLFQDLFPLIRRKLGLGVKISRLLSRQWGGLYWEGSYQSPDKRTPAEGLSGSPAKIVPKSPRPALIRIRESTFEMFCPDKTHPFPCRPILGLPGVLSYLDLYLNQFNERAPNSRLSRQIT